MERLLEYRVELGSLIAVDIALERRAVCRIVPVSSVFRCTGRSRNVASGFSDRRHICAARVAPPFGPARRGRHSAPPVSSVVLNISAIANAHGDPSQNHATSAGMITDRRMCRQYSAWRSRHRVRRVGTSHTSPSLSEGAIGPAAAPSATTATMDSRLFSRSPSGRYATA